MDNNISKSTQCVHSGTYSDLKTRGVNSPVFTSTSFEYLDSESLIYPRSFNTPNQEILVKKLCALEKGEDGLVFSSGMAAISSTILSLLKPGDHAIFQNDIYGGTHHFVSGDMLKFGIDFSFADSGQMEDLSKIIKPNTKLIYVESPSNPLLEIIDLKAIAKLGRDRNIITVIDNTFATPINQNPIDFGIDVVVHSGSKYIGGHSDIMCGAVISSQKIIKQIKETALNLGGILNASTCALIERSLKTLALRVEKQCANAEAIAYKFENHPKLKKIYYPGLKSHKGYEIAKQQMASFGAVVSFELKEIQYAEKFLRKLHIISPALSLGGVESTICVPACTSHSKISAEDRKAAGISDGLLRLAVGIEDVEDLIKDIQQALDHV
jgi:cystathionine beta-lyase/cystathionine gamma-synthase